MMEEHESLVLATDLPDESLKEGDIGTVVHVQKDGAAYEVEFMTLDGETVATVTLEKHQVRPVGRCQVHHARSLEWGP